MDASQLPQRGYLMNRSQKAVQVDFEPQPPRCAAKCPVCSQLSPIPRIGDLWRSHLVLESDLRGVSSGKYMYGKYSIPGMPCAKQQSLMCDEIWI